MYDPVTPPPERFNHEEWALAVLYVLLLGEYLYQLDRKKLVTIGNANCKSRNAQEAKLGVQLPSD